MYWIFLVLFIITILIPDIVRRPILFLTEERAEEVAVFFMGVIAFLVFMRNEYKLSIQKKEKEKEQKKMKQAVKDLVESYSYIGEVNRKMDIIMSIALGLSDRSTLNKNREKEIYESIVSAANFLMKADYSLLRFVDNSNFRNLKEIKMEKKKVPVFNEELTKMGDSVNIKKIKDCLIICSPQKINEIRGYLIICGYDEEEEKNPKNMEILKVFASQALFLYSYLSLENGNKQNKKEDNN
jgi:hypothetical protein